MYKDQINYFVLVYETGSFALAGKLIPLSAQGVGKAIRALEQELHRPLFAEGTLAPTPYADAFYKFAKSFNEDYEFLMIEMDAIDAMLSNVIRLGFSGGTLDVIGTEVLSAFKAECPDVDFRYEEVTDGKCDENLVHGIYDLAFTIDPIPCALEGVQLFSAPMTLWVNTNDPLSKKEKVALSDLGERVIATPAPGAKNVDKLLSMKAADPQLSGPVVHLLQMFRIYDFVREGKGVGTHIAGLIESEAFHTDSVTSIPLEDFVFTLRISWVKNRKLTDNERAFVDYIARHPKIKAIQKAIAAYWSERERGAISGEA